MHAAATAAHKGSVVTINETCYSQQLERISESLEQELGFEDKTSESKLALRRGKLSI